MRTSNPIYLRQLIPDLYKNKKNVIRFMILCICLFLVIGYYRLGTAQTSNEAELEEINTYTEQLASYDNTLEEVQTSLDLVDEQINDLQEYIDQSIYMKLDSQNIHMFNLQYTVTSEANVGNILNAFTIFINDGGIQEDITESNPELEPNYWREVLSCGISGNNLNIVLMHYDEEKGNQIIEIIKDRLQNQISSIAAAQGNFTFTEINSSHYLKADSTVTNTQNDYKGNLKNYTSNRVDFENKLINQQNARKKLIENSEPEDLTIRAINPIIFMMKYLFVGIIFGIAIPCAFFLVRYTLGNRIHSAEDLKIQGIEVLGTVSQNDNSTEQLKDLSALTNILLKKNNFSNPCIRLLSTGDLGKKEYDSFSEQLRGYGHTLNTEISNTATDISFIEQLSDSDSCIFVLVQEESTYPKLEAAISLCKTLQIPVLGCIFIKQ